MWQKTKNIYHLFVAVLANGFFRFPGRRLRVIGVTGTDGKTTTTTLIYHILKSAGKNVSLISTVAAYIGENTYDTGFHVTNPSSIPLQKFLQKITQLGAEDKENYLVLEVTSHGIDQNRIWGIPFAIAVVTNITHEHLDYHKTYDHYLQTKARLLKKAHIAILNKDDSSYEPLIKLLGPKKIISYGVNSVADVTPKTFPFVSQMQGGFEQYNELAAISVCRELGISETVIKKGIETFELPKGRMEIVYNKSFTVIVDFAHTPNAFAQLLPQLKKKYTGRLIHVFGAAGERDKTKRPEMGKISATFADVSIVTSEDPRSEHIDKISEHIIQGMERKNEHYLIPDRKEAIEKGVFLAKKGDVVVVTGKAHEGSMNYGHGEQLWDEFGVVESALKKRGLI